MNNTILKVINEEEISENLHTSIKNLNRNLKERNKEKFISIIQEEFGHRFILISEFEMYKSSIVLKDTYSNTTFITTPYNFIQNKSETVAYLNTLTLLP